MAEMDRGEEAGFGGVVWTDEKHTSYLNWMEASFVRCMLFGSQPAYERPPPPLRLDRYLPDGADSTLDCRASKGGRRRAVAAARPSRPCQSRRVFAEGHGRTRRRCHRRCTAPPVQEDQVVPAMEGTASAAVPTSGDDQHGAGE